jgi:hypothetical protein
MPSLCIGHAGNRRPLLTIDCAIFNGRTTDLAQWQI